MERHQVNGVTVLGSIQGFVPDGETVAAALAELAPSTVALGIPPEDLPGLAALHDDPSIIDREAPELPEPIGAGAPGLEGMYGVGHLEDQAPEGEDASFGNLEPVHEHLLSLLGRFGETSVPSPDLQGAYAWAQCNGADVETIDLDDEEHTAAYIAANKFLDIIRGNRMKSKLLKRTFDECDDAASLIRAFDGHQMQVQALRMVEAAREAHMAEQIKALPEGSVAIVPLARLDGILELA